MKDPDKRTRRSDCPICFGLDIFGDKWTLLILRDIMFFSRTRFSDFATEEHIATNILADRLSRLEEANIIEKHRDTELKNQYVYSVTQKGKDLLPILIEMALWGLQYDSNTPADQAFVEQIRADKQKIALEMTRSINSGAFLKYMQSEIGV